MKFNYIRLVLLVLGLTFTFGSFAQKKKEKPNIILIFADDQCYRTINALGNKEVITPNLDKLVDEGVTFESAFNMGGWNGAVCVASRAMLNTGRFIWRAKKAVDYGLDTLAVQGKMWGNLMKNAGYITYMSGKWHVAIQPEKCFDTVSHQRPGMPKQTKWGYNRPKDENDTIWRPWDKKFGGYWEGGKHWSEVLKDDALHFIDEASKQDKPFFMYLAFNAPHDPRQSPKKFVDMYPLENISVPETFMPVYPYKDEIGLKRLRDERLAPMPRTEYAVKVNRQEYYAIITHMDYQIGQILEALEKSGKMDNTYIIFSADHGLAVGNHGLIGKQNMYDHSMRVPLMIVGPDIPENKRIDVDVYLQDIMATALDLAGVEKPDYVEFNSLLPFIRGEQSESNYDAIYGCYINWQRMIRKDGFKLIVYPKAQMVLLYDLNNDPLEMTNLSDNPRYFEKKKSLFEDLLVLQQQMDDTLNLKPLYNKLFLGK